MPSQKTARLAKLRILGQLSLSGTKAEDFVLCLNQYAPLNLFHLSLVTYSTFPIQFRAFRGILKFQL